jgi:6-phosphogluconolactonase
MERYSTVKKPEIWIGKDPDAVARKAAALLVSESKRAIQIRSRASVVLSGGSTPKKLHRLLATDFAQLLSTLWKDIHFFFGDERSVPPEHAESNYRMAKETLFDHAPIPRSNIHRIRAEETAAQAAELYEKELRQFFGSAQPANALPRFDLIFLGLGTDGHTASLFPQTAALAESKRWVVSNSVDKLGTERITLTYPVLNNAKQILFMVTGAEKAAVLKEILQTKAGRYPAEKIQPLDGSVLWLLDKAAASQLSD